MTLSLNRVVLAAVACTAAATFGSVTIAAAACAPSCPNTGGGKDVTTDCFSEFASEALELNAPFFNPNKPKAQKELRCHDGEPACDLDGEVNNSCTFPIDLCLFNNDPNLSECTPQDVISVDIKRSTSPKFPQLAALQSAVDAILPASSLSCTTGQELTVPLKGPNGKGLFKAAKSKVKLITTSATDKDKDGVKLVCVPHNWPHHGYDSNNRRSTPLTVGIDTTNVDTLVSQWSFFAGGPVTSTPTVDKKQIYISSWDGIVTALKRKTGAVKWQYSTLTAGVLGVQSSVTLTADGRVIVGDSLGKVHALSAKKGELLWIADAADTDPAAGHIWGSPTVAAGKVFVGRASHNDQPCSPGTVYAFDLDTGAELWRFQTVPDGVCYADTTTECAGNGDCAGNSPCSTGFCVGDKSVSCSIDGDCAGLFGNSVGPCVTGNACTFAPSTECTTDADCPSCVEISGGGVTAAPAVSADGETVYVVTVGCLSEPSVGLSDSIIALDANTGAMTWVNRTQSVEQVIDGPPYQDFGFLNGPILASVADGGGGEVAVVAAGSKDGTLYAVDQATGALVWSREVAPAPDFAGFGLFNGAVGFSGGNFFAALYEFTGWPGSNDHAFAFSGEDGATVWSDQIGTSWGDVTIAGGVMYTGNVGASEFYAYDAATGVLLATLDVPNSVAGGAAVVDNQLVVPFGILGAPGGVRVFTPAD
ncbi:MAG: outer membrane protein assembly factor BamB [Hyphomicrobiaceae bacterium]|jgi:outer membrane protein assembly factor BamB